MVHKDSFIASGVYGWIAIIEGLQIDVTKRDINARSCDCSEFICTIIVLGAKKNVRACMGEWVKLAVLSDA